MKDSARGIIQNFLYLVHRFGYVPNGSRIYYLMRSQPPLLIQMAASYYTYTDDLDFIKKNIQVSIFRNVFLFRQKIDLYLNYEFSSSNFRICLILSESYDQYTIEKKRLGVTINFSLDRKQLGRRSKSGCHYFKTTQPIRQTEFVINEYFLCTVFIFRSFVLFTYFSD